MAKKTYEVPVVYEMYGTVRVEAESAAEAYDEVRDHPENFPLPDEGTYVDDSFRVADDDRDNAIGSIEEADDKAASGRRHTGLTVKATVTFQRWERDYARFNGEAEFDACDALDSMSDEQIAEVERDEPYTLDEVYRSAVRLGQIHDYDGPFEVCLDEDDLSAYLEARRKASIAEKGLTALIKTHNSPISAMELKEELEIQDVPSEYADTGLWVRPEDLDYAESLLADLEARSDEEW